MSISRIHPSDCQSCSEDPEPCAAHAEDWRYWRARALDAEEDLRVNEGTRDRMRAILDNTVNIVRGDPGPLEMHGWADLPERVRELQLEISAHQRKPEGALPGWRPSWEKGPRRDYESGCWGGVNTAEDGVHQWTLYGPADPATGLRKGLGQGNAGMLREAMRACDEAEAAAMEKKPCA